MPGIDSLEMKYLFENKEASHFFQEPLQQLAEKLALPVFHSISEKDTISETHPHSQMKACKIKISR